MRNRLSSLMFSKKLKKRRVGEIIFSVVLSKI